MKKIFLILISVLICAVVSAQLPVAAKIVNLGSTVPGKIVPFNNAKADTLKSGDTLFYKVLVNHSTCVFPYISQLTKLVASDTTAKMTLWQSVAGSSNWQLIKQSLPTDTTMVSWQKLIAKSSTAGTDFSGWRSNLKFDSQYFGIRFIANVKSGFKTIYSGSVRFNEK